MQSPKGPPVTLFHATICPVAWSPLATNKKLITTTVSLMKERLENYHVLISNTYSKHLILNERLQMRKIIDENFVLNLSTQPFFCVFNFFFFD